MRAHAGRLLAFAWAEQPAAWRRSAEQPPAEQRISSKQARSAWRPLLGEYFRKGHLGSLALLIDPFPNPRRCPSETCARVDGNHQHAALGREQGRNRLVDLLRRAAGP